MNDAIDDTKNEEQSASTRPSKSISFDDLDETQKRPRITLVSPDQVYATGPMVEVVPDASTQQLIDQSIRGTQWIMVAILIGVPLGFATNVLMARISPYTLGAYSLVLVLATTVQTFFLFGGANVVVNFLPRATARERSAFLLSYAGIALVFSVFFFVFVLARSDVLKFLLLNSPVTTTTYIYILLFFPIVILQTLAIAVLQGEMALGAAARTQYAVQALSFALALVALLFIHGHKGNEMVQAFPIAGAVVLGAYLLSFLSGLFALLRVIRRDWKVSLRWYLPPSFWRFTTTVHLLSIVTFFFNSVDQLFIVYAFGGLANNGAYTAAAKVATYALWAPNLFTGAMYPFFTNLVARHDFATLKAAYQRYTAITAVVVATMGVSFGLFAPQILALFGRTYVVQSLPLMFVFTLMYAALASSAYVPTAALITANEAVWINLVMNTVALGLRFVLYFELTPDHGLLGVAIANAISLAVLSIGTLIVCSLRYHVNVPWRQHMVSLIASVVLIASYAVAPLLSSNTQLLERGVALIVFFVVVAQLRLISKSELASVANRLPFLKRLLPLGA